MRKAIVYGIVGIILIIISIGLLKDDPINDSFTGEYEVQEVKIGSLNETIFLKQVTWGVSSDSKITAISTSPDKKIDYMSEEDVLYKSGSTLFYKVKSDTLCILTTILAEKPISFKSNVVVYQEEIDSRRFNQLIKSYEDEGFRKFPK